MPENFATWLVAHEGMDEAQTVVLGVMALILVVMAGAQIYTLLLLRNEVRGAASTLKRVIDELADTRARLDKIEGR